MIITHYFPFLGKNRAFSNRELFTSITEYSVREQQEVISRLATGSGRALRRFDQFENYMQRRTQTEHWLYSTFFKMGGRPSSCHPFYFILGENESLKHDFGPAAGELKLDTAEINVQDISFTIGDSIGLYFSSAQKRVYSLNEIELLSQNAVYIQKQMKLLPQYHQYIEAQLWNKVWLSKTRIIIYYPTLFDRYERACPPL